MSIARVVVGVLITVVIIGAFVIQRYAFWLIFKEFWGTALKRRDR
jgi:hypothetical protein